MPMKKAVSFTDGPIIPHMLIFSFPIIMGNLFYEAYNPADTLIVGRCPGPYALASVGIGLLFLLYSYYRGTGRPEWSIVLIVFSPRNESTCCIHTFPSLRREGNMVPADIVGAAAIRKVKIRKD